MQSQSITKDNQPLLLRVSEAARALSISRSRAYELCAAGIMPGVVRFGASIRIRRADLEEWVAALGQDEAAGASWQGQPAAKSEEKRNGQSQVPR